MNNAPANGKAYKRFNELLPRDGFTSLKYNDFKEMMKIIHNEPDKKLKHIYFTQVMGKLFAPGWGWYMRLGQSLSGMRPITSVAALPAEKRDTGLRVLKLVKDMHIELHYSPSYMATINSFIVDFGGRRATSAEIADQKMRSIKRGTQRVLTRGASAATQRKLSMFKHNIQITK